MRNWSDRVGYVVVAGSVTVLAGILGVGMAHGGAVPKVTICHVPPGNPTNVQQITVGAPAVAQHVAQHGDIECAEGDCCADDDGAVCTNLDSDVNSCGECGHACATGETCTDGECGVPLPQALQLVCECRDATGSPQCVLSSLACGTSCPPDGERSRACEELCGAYDCPTSNAIVRSCVETSHACAP